MAVERMLISAFLILIFTVLFFVAMYHIYMFASEGGFTNSISVRLLIAGVCFNSIVLAICSYLIIQVRLLMRLIDKLQNGEQEKPKRLNEKFRETLRGRSTSKRNHE